MNRRYKPTPPLDLSATLTFINIKVSGWKRLSRRRFKVGEKTDQAPTGGGAQGGSLAARHGGQAQNPKRHDAER